MYAKLTVSGNNNISFNLHKMPGLILTFNPHPIFTGETEVRRVYMICQGHMSVKRLSKDPGTVTLELRL